MIRAILKRISELSQRTTRLDSSDVLIVQRDGESEPKWVRPALGVPNNSVDTGQLVTGSVTGDKIGTAAVSAVKLGQNATGQAYSAQSTGTTLSTAWTTAVTVSVTVLSAQAPATVVLIGTAGILTSGTGGRQGQIRLTWNSVQVGQSQYTHYVDGDGVNSRNAGSTACVLATIDAVSASTYTAAIQAKADGYNTTPSVVGCQIVPIVLART